MPYKISSSSTKKNAHTLQTLTKPNYAIGRGMKGTQMTNEEAVQIMRDHLLAQFIRCCNDQGRCVYINEDNNRCVAGALIPDYRIDRYRGDTAMSASVMIEQEIKDGEEWCKDLNPDMLDAAQDIHDHGSWDNRIARFDEAMAEYV